MHIRPFQALRPCPALASAVASAPYDVLDTVEASELAAGNPNSFLHIIRSEIDLPPGTDLHSDPVYAKAVRNFAGFRKKGVLTREDAPCVYVYRQRTQDRSQNGIVTCCRVEDYENNVIRKHEKTRSDKEADRARHIRELNAHTGPVFLAYRDDPSINEIVAREQEKSPLFDFSSPDRVEHTVWRVTGSEIVEAFGNVPRCYIADGHHRAAAAAKVAAERRAANASHAGAEEYNWFLGVLFPASQLTVLPYNRLVRDLNGMDPEGFLKEVGTRFRLRETAKHTPSERGAVDMYLDGKWYELTWPPISDPGPAASLDLNVLHRELLAPVLAIHDPRASRRISFVGGHRSTGELVRRVDSGQDAVAFSMYPVRIEDLMAISDAGEIMPPKSTWFEPKLRSGLFVHTL